jgi:hypothetical protein
VNFTLIQEKQMQDNTPQSTDTSDTSAAVDSYDLHIVPAETAARKEREGENYKQLPTDDEDKDKDSIDTTGGFTMDKEGLVNNYAIEPEMYVEVPGDLQPPDRSSSSESN